MSTRGQWADAFLRRLQYPTTVENVVAMLAWMRSEFGGKVPCPADYNPLATTLKVEGSTRFNTAGVQKFKTFDDGVHANAHVLLEHHGGYDAIRSALTAGHDPYAVVDAVHGSQWGSHPTHDMVDHVRSVWPTDSLLLLHADDMHDTPSPHVDAPGWPGVLLRNYHEGDGTATWQQRMATRGWRIAVDDKYGPQSEGVAAAFQQEKGLDVDGIVGPVTWRAAWVAPIT